MKQRSQDVMVGYPVPHASSPVTVSGTSQRFAVTAGVTYNFKLTSDDTEGNVVLEIGDVTVVAVDTGAVAIGTTIRWDDPYTPITIPESITDPYVAVINTGSGSPVIIIERNVAV